MTWKEIFQTTRVRWAIAFWVVSLLVMFLYVPFFYSQIINPKAGYLIDDPLLNALTPINWSLPIFAILYAAVIQTLVSSAKKPEVFILGATTYCAVNILRVFTMYAVTLEPPVGMILLADPISSILYPDSGFAKDLFFSGHISTIMIMVLVEENRVAKISKIIGATLMGVFLAWQHVHYLIDLLAAPIITYWVFGKIRNMLKSESLHGPN